MVKTTGKRETGENPVQYPLLLAPETMVQHATVAIQRCIDGKANQKKMGSKSEDLPLIFNYSGFRVKS